MLLRVATVFAVLLLLQIAQAELIGRSKRQSCECTPGEAPKCACQVVPSADPSKNVQMVCSCSPAVAPKCVCKETKTSPMLPSPSELAAVAVQYKCTDVCQKSCLEPCQRLQTNNKCREVCADACQFSCTKQEGVKISPIAQKGNHFNSEYKFIIPSNPQPTMIPMPPSPPMIITTRPTAPPPMPPMPPPPPPHTNLVPVMMTKTCEPACMPDCSFTCTTFKPALKLITEVIDGKTGNSGECQKTCGDTCLSVCRTTGVNPSECQMNCGPACGETCGIVMKKVTPHCSNMCMPMCSQQCLQTEILLSFMPDHSVPPMIPPQPAMIVTATSAPSPQLAARCQNECSVQCEHQCGVHSLAGPQCLAACQTTCYPVCQAKLRRKHLRASRQREQPE